MTEDFTRADEIQLAQGAAEGEACADEGDGAEACAAAGGGSGEVQAQDSAQDDAQDAVTVLQPPNGGEIVPTGSGVKVADVVEDQGDPVRVYAPDHPLADDEGYVTQAKVDLAGQLTDMMLAQRTYQANARTVQTAKEAYETALQIGRG